MDKIQHEIKEVKGYSKKYKTKNGTIKETKPNKSISLGANSIFKPGEEVTIIRHSDYNKFLDYYSSNNGNKELETQLKNSSEKFQELDKKYKEQFQEFQELKKDHKELQQQLELLREKHQLELKELNDNLNKANDKKDTLYNSLLVAKDKLNYYEIILTKYRNMGILKRLFKHDPTNETPAPEPLEIPPKE